MKTPAFLSRYSLVYLVLATALLGINATRADTVASFSGNGSYGVLYPKGQSFTTLSSTAENNIAFNLFSFGTGAAYAAGTGFLYSQVYTGTLDALGTASPTFLGSAASSGGYYHFDSSLTLSPGTQYFFYENASFGNSPVILKYGGTYAGGMAYSTPGTDGGETFSSSGGQSFSFEVTGSPVTSTVPDTGSSALLLGLGIVALLGGASLFRHQPMA